MSPELLREPTVVPISGSEDVELSPGQPWPSAYRGSRYSVVRSSRGNREAVLKWEYKDLRVHLELPEKLREGLRRVGKSGGSGHGSLRITAAGEVLTKVQAHNYDNADEAPVSDGWIPVYVGQLSGNLAFEDVDVDPEPLGDDEIAVWEGLPFNHGERWAVSGRGNLIWKWRDYRFQSAFDHSELVSRYRRYRQPAGRLYVTEFGHVYVNVDPDTIPDSREDLVLGTFEQWRNQADRNGNNPALRLVTRRLKSTTNTNDLRDGLLPMYIGHLSDFDGGVIPKPIVDDDLYFRACGREEIAKG